MLIGPLLSGAQAAVTKKGKLYVKISRLGTGQYKDTYTFIKIGTVAHPSFVTVGKVQTKLKAVAIAKSVPAKSMVALEHANEMELHRELTALRKEAAAQGQQDPLSHVATSKKVTSLSSSSSSVGLMGALYSAGTVDSLLQNKDLTGSECRSICAGMLLGINQLHSINIVHRDIKTDNLLLQEENDGISAVLCDLGKASHTEEGKRVATPFQFFSLIKPPGAMNAEVAFSKELDIYQAGRTVYQIFAGVPLKNCKSIYQESPERERLIQQIKSEKGIEKNHVRIQTLSEHLVELEKKLLIPPQDWPNWNRIPEKVKEQIEKMVDADPSRRPTLEECREFFDSLNDEDVWMPVQSSPVDVVQTPPVSPASQTSQGPKSFYIDAA